MQILQLLKNQNHFDTGSNMRNNRTIKILLIIFNKILLAEDKASKKEMDSSRIFDISK